MVSSILVPNRPESADPIESHWSLNDPIVVVDPDRRETVRLGPVGLSDSHLRMRLSPHFVVTRNRGLPFL